MKQRNPGTENLNLIVSLAILAGIGYIVIQTRNINWKNVGVIVDRTKAITDHIPVETISDFLVHF